jgi:hypothetical protein
VPLDNEQDVEPQQPHEENKEPQPVRSLHERSVTSNDYVVYIDKDVNDMGKMDDRASYKVAMMSENSQKWLEAMDDHSMSSNDV